MSTLFQNTNPADPENDDSSKDAGSVFLSDRLLNVLQTSVIFFDRQGKVFRANDMARKDLNRTEKIEGQKLTDLLYVEYLNRDILPELLSRFDDARTEQAELPKNCLVSTKDGTAIFFATGCISRLDSGRFLLSFRNIADEKTQEYMIKMALSSTKIFPWFYDFKRNVMIIDPRYFTYTGIPTEDYTMSLEAFSERLHPDDREQMAQAFALQLHGEHYPYPVPYRLRLGNGRYEWFEGQSTYLGQVQSGMPYRIVGVCMSTQAHKDIEEALTAAKDKAEQSDKLKSAFLANMSHEIRTPLNAIVGFSNLLAGGETDPGSDDAKEYASLIAKNCDHLLTLVSDILDLSRIETDAMEYNMESLLLSRFLTEIYQNRQSTVPEGVAFNLRLPPEELRIVTDPMRLRQVVEHLIGNAAKFTTQGHIDLGYMLSSDKKCVRLFVIDTGRGIPADSHEKIFERFYKVDSFIQGAGLGLSICKTIIERLGGTITVSSHPGKGAQFTLRLPLAPSKNNN